jgi:hypothetical protein
MNFLLLSRYINNAITNKRIGGQNHKKGYKSELLVALVIKKGNKTINEILNSPLLNIPSIVGFSDF